MISRRSVLAGMSGLAGGLLVPRFVRALPVPEDGRLAFRILRKGDFIGRHALAFARDGENLTVTIAVEIEVTFGPIRFYRYRHDATERWLGGDVVSLQARTDDNGDAFKVTMSRTEEGFNVVGATGDYLAPPDTHPATHWNRRQLEGPMVNTQTGELMRPAIAELGSEPVARVDGAQMRATRYNLSGDARFDIWYSERGDWAGLSFKGGDGAEIRYVAL